MIENNVMKKSLKRYSKLNKEIYFNLKAETDSHYALKGPGKGEKQIKLEEAGAKVISYLNTLIEIENAVLKIIDYKISSKRNYAVLLNNKFMNDLLVSKNPNEFFISNHLSPLISLFDKAMMLQKRRIERYKVNGKDIDFPVSMGKKGQTIPLAFIFFYSLIRRHYKLNFKASISRYSEHYRRVTKELKTHHSKMVDRYGDLIGFSLKLPIRAERKTDFSEFEINSYISVLQKFLNNARKNHILEHKVGYIVSRSFISEEFPGISIILFFKRSILNEHKRLDIINEVLNYWSKIYNKNIKSNLTIEYAHQLSFGIYQMFKMNKEHLNVSYSLQLALQGDVIRSKNAPKRKKYYSKSQEL